MMKYRQDELRQALMAAGASTGRKGPADVLAAIAVCEGEDGWALERVGCATVFNLPVRQGAALNPLRNPDWLRESLGNACTGALAFARMVGFHYWDSYVTKDYREYLPEFFPPELRYDSPDGVPYKLIRILPHYSIFDLLKLCGWIAPSTRDALSVIRANGWHASDWPVNEVMKVPNQRGW